MTAAMDTNPVFLIISAIAALVAALSVLALSYDDGIESAKEMTTASRAAADELDNINKKYDDTTSANKAAVITARQYVGMLKDLEAQGLKTKEQQDQYRIIVEKLNQTMPELNVTIDAQTGKINGGTDALMKNIDAWEDYYKQQALMEKYDGQMKERAKVEVEIAENQVKLKKATSDLSDAEKERAEIMDKMNKRTDELTEAAKKQSKEQGQMVSAGLEYDQVLLDLQKQLDENTIETIHLGQQQKECNKAIEDGQETLGTFDEELKLVAETIKSLSDTEGEAALTTDELNAKYTELQARYGELAGKKEEYIAATQGMTEAEAAEYDQALILGGQYDMLLEKYGSLGVSREDYIAATASMTDAQQQEYDATLLQDAALATLQTRYEEAYLAAYDSLSGQISMWQKMDNKATTSAKTLKSAVDSQATYYSNYTANLNSLLSRNIAGVDKLASRFKDGSTESAAALAGLAKASDKEIVDLIASMNKTEAGKSQMASTLASLEVEGTTAFGNMGDSATEFTDTFNSDMADTATGGKAYQSNLKQMENDTSKAMNSIISHVNSVNSKMPTIKFKLDTNLKLPHFSMSGAFNAQSGSVPSVKVQWYDKGGLFKSPQLIGIAENRPEFVGAAQDLRSFINEAMEDAFNIHFAPTMINNTASGARYGDVNIHMPVQILPTAALTRPEIHKAAKVLTDEVSRELGRRFNGAR